MCVLITRKYITYLGVVSHGAYFVANCHAVHPQNFRHFWWCKVTMYRHVRSTTHASNDEAASVTHGVKRKYMGIKGKLVNRQYLKNQPTISNKKIHVKISNKMACLYHLYNIHNMNQHLRTLCLRIFRFKRDWYMDFPTQVNILESARH